MVLPAARSFDSTMSSPSSFTRNPFGDNVSAHRMKFGSMFILGMLIIFASVIAPLREWQFLDAQDHRRESSYEASYGIIPLEQHTSSSSSGDGDDAVQQVVSSSQPDLDQTDRDGRKEKAVAISAIHVSNATIDSTDQTESQQAAIPLKRNFSGIIARPFSAWPLDVPLPCFPAEENWAEIAAQFAPASQGFFYLKPYKTGSSTTSGVNLRIARNVARRRQDLENVDMCKTRFDHGPDFYAGNSLFAQRNPSESFLWTILRDPTSRAVSQFFHFEVSRAKLEPTDSNFKHFLKQKHPIQDYYFRALYTKARFSRDRYHPVKVANHILRNYNFIGITERLDESFVVLMMQLNLKIGDILYLSAKGRGGYDDAGGRKHQCTYIWPSFLSPGMKLYFQSDEWKDTIKYDMLLYQAVNRSLDMTIDKLGREAFDKNLAKFKNAQEQATIRCLPSTIFPCDAAGRMHRESETGCLWKDSGCGSTCLDELATELDLW
jgi:Galactose-3-O-sulfotransferase